MKRFLAMLLAVMMIVSLLPMTAFAAETTRWDTLTLARNGSPLVEGTDYTVSEIKTSPMVLGFQTTVTAYKYTIITQGPVTLSGGCAYPDSRVDKSNKSEVIFANGADIQDVTLDNVTCLGALRAENGKTLNVTLKGTNNVDYIYVNGFDTSAVFGGDGTLTGRQIGSEIGKDCGSITINSGTYNLDNRASTQNAAIGGGENGKVNAIVINGGTINAKASYGAAIGSGQGGEGTTIAVTGGTIDATSDRGAAIGSGGIITDGKTPVAPAVEISGGSIKVSSDRGEPIGAGNGATPTKVEISGGTFETMPKADYVVVGAEITVGDKTYTKTESGEVVEEPTTPASTAVAKIGNTEYESVAAALAEAGDGDTVIVVKDTEETINSIGHNVVALDGVKAVFNHAAKYGDYLATGVTLTNITWNVGSANYQYFINSHFVNCTVSGQFCFQDGSSAEGTTFIQSDGDWYNVWAYGNCSFTNCTFINTVKGKFINVFTDNYNEFTVSVDGCTFINEGNSSKAALNVKEGRSGQLLKPTVNITGTNVVAGNFPVASDGDKLTVVNPLVQVDDKLPNAHTEGGSETKVNVTETAKLTTLPLETYTENKDNKAALDAAIESVKTAAANDESTDLAKTDPVTGEKNTNLYSTPAVEPEVTGVAMIGEQTFETLAAAIANAESGATITVIGNISGESISINKPVTIKGTEDVVATDLKLNYNCSNNSALTLDGLTIRGDSCIALNRVQQTPTGTVDLTVKNCDIDLSGSVFICAGSSDPEYYANMNLEMSNNKIVTVTVDSPSYAPARVMTSSINIYKANIINNVFGTAEKPMKTAAFKLGRRVENASFVFDGNTLHADATKHTVSLFDLWQSGSNAADNTKITLTDNDIYAYNEGTKHVVLTQLENTVNGSNGTAIANDNTMIRGGVEAPVACSDILFDTVAAGKQPIDYIAIDAETDASGKLTSGTVMAQNLEAAKAHFAEGYEAKQDENGNYVVEPAAPAAVAKIDSTEYETLAAAIANVKEGETIDLLAGTIEEGEITLPASLKNVTIKGAADNASVLKNTQLVRRTGGANYDGFTVDGVVFDNSRVMIVSWDQNSSYKNFVFTNNTFKNLNDSTNEAAIHINVNAPGSIQNLTLTGNTFDSLTGGSKSGIYGAVTGNVTITGNTINNVAFRPICLQVTDTDGIDDNVVIDANACTGTAIGRIQVSGNMGDDNVTLLINNNICKNITNQQICCWNFKEANTKADFTHNYYDDPEGYIYWNDLGNVYLNTEDAAELPHANNENFGFYTELSEDGTIDEASYQVVEAAPELTPDAEGIYHIANMDDLNTFRSMVNGGETFEGKTVVLDADITFTGTWDSGIGTDASKFAGTFDGNGKTITGLKINGGSSQAALFNYVYNGTVKDLTIDQATITGNEYVAAIFALNVGTVENCTVKNSTITGNEQIGGIAGFINAGSVKNCTVDNCTITANVNRAGGILGKGQRNGSYDIIGCTVKDTTVTAAEKSGGMRTAAGLVGQMMNVSAITDNNIIDVATKTGTDETFVPIGEFRNGEYVADAVSSGKIARNHWEPETEPDSYNMVNPADNTQSVTIYNFYPVCEIVGGHGYATVAEAIADAKSGETIKLIKSVDENVTVAAGKNIVLDLNGFTVNGGDTSVTPTITNNGTLTITDSSEDGTGMIKRTETNKSPYYVIDNTGNLTIDKANVYNKMNGENASLIRSSTGKLTINDGTFKCEEYAVIKLESGDLEINGGFFDSYDQGTTLQIYGNAVINGGSFTRMITKESGGTIVINAGNFKYDYLTYVGTDSFELIDKNQTYAEGYRYQVKLNKDAPEEYDAKLVPNTGAVAYYIGTTHADGANEAQSKQYADCTVYYNYAPTNVKQLSNGSFYAWYKDGIEKDGHYSAAAGYEVLSEVNEETGIIRYYTAVTENSAFAKIVRDGEDLYFWSIAYAAQNAQAGETVVVLKDDTSTTRVVGQASVPNSLTLDLNGKTIAGNLTSSKDNKSLTVIDSVGNGGATNFVNNYLDTASLTIKAGTFTNYIFAQKGTITIEGGYFTGDLAEKQYNNIGSATNSGELVITGGYFVNNPTAFVADGYKVVASDIDGYNHKVVPVTYVAQIGETKYATLADAVVAANQATSWTQIYLIADTAVDETIELNNVNGNGTTLHTNGHVLTANAPVFKVTTALTYLGDGTGALTDLKTDHLFVANGGTIKINQDSVFTSDSVKEFLNEHAYYLVENDGKYTVTTYQVDTAQAAGFVAMVPIDSTSNYFKTVQEAADAGNKTSANLIADVTNGSIVAEKFFTLYTEDLFWNAYNYSGSITVPADKNLNINGGTYNNGKVTLTNVVCGELYLVNNADVTVANGMVKTIDVYSGTLNITGGIYGVDPTAYVADGYVAVANDDPATSGTYGYKVIEAPKNFYQDAENANLWHVANEAGWVEFAAAVNGGTTFEGKTVILDKHLDMSAYEKVDPVGDFNNKPFMGTFDGNEKTISNINVYRFYNGVNNSTGVFGKVYAPAVIKDLTVTNATITADRNAAGDKAGAYVGGIAGHGYADISNCSFSGTIYGGHQIGGIAGSGGFTITGCTFDGDIVSTRYWALGGIIGNCQDGGAISGNTAMGTITASCDGESGKYMGGIVGCPVYNTQVISGNNSQIALTYNGEKVNNPIVGAYNDDNNKAMQDDFSAVSGNTWDKTIYNFDTFKIVRDFAGETEWVAHYNGPTFKPVAMIGDTDYPSVEAAIAAAKANDTIVLVAASAESITLPFGVTFNTNGKSYTGNVSAPTGYVVEENEGVYTVKLDASVAQNKDTGKKYTTLEEALEEAVSGQTVFLLKNIGGDGANCAPAEKYVIVENGITLDLKGFNIVGARLIYVTGTLIDTATVKGTISATAYMFTCGDAYTTTAREYVPIYNGTGYSMYKLFFSGNNTGYEKDNKLVYYALGGNDESRTAAQEILANGRFKSVIVLKWNNGTNDVEKTFTMTQDYMNDYFTKLVAKEFPQFTAVITGNTTKATVESRFVSYDEFGNVLYYIVGPSYELEADTVN